MSKKQQVRILNQVNHIGFAFLVGIGATVGLGIKTGNLAISVAIGIVVFMIFGLELN
jgi:hypothetical protein